MTEFETATIAYQNAALWASYGQIAATVTIGVGQIAIVWFGIRAMQRMGQARAREQDQRHAESMAALQASISGQEEDRAALRALIAGQEEDRAALRALVAGQEALIAGQEEDRAALRALVERTAPKEADR